MRAAEVAFVAFLERLALLVADEHDLVLIELGEAGAQRAVVAEELVAVQLDELVEHQVEVIGEHRPIGMPGDLDRFPGIELAVDAARRVGQLAAERADLVAQLGPFRLARFQLSDAFFELIDRLLECQSVSEAGHRGKA